MTTLLVADHLILVEKSVACFAVASLFSLGVLEIWPLVVSSAAVPSSIYGFGCISLGSLRVSHVRIRFWSALSVHHSCLLLFSSCTCWIFSACTFKNDLFIWLVVCVFACLSLYTSRACRSPWRPEECSPTTEVSGSCELLCECCARLQSAPNLEPALPRLSTRWTSVCVLFLSSSLLVLHVLLCVFQLTNLLLAASVAKHIYQHLNFFYCYRLSIDSSSNASEFLPKFSTLLNSKNILVVITPKSVSCHLQT